MFIDGIGISEYRSFGCDLQRIGPFTKVNFFIGRNNSGKSNILYFLRYHYALILGRQDPGFKDVDRHIGSSSGKGAVELALKIGSENYNAITKRHEERIGCNPRLTQLIEKILQSETLSHSTGLAWFRYEQTDRNNLSPDLLDEILKEFVLTNSDWSTLWQALTRNIGGDLRHQLIPETLHSLSPVLVPAPKIELIPAVRKVTKGDWSEGVYSGAGLIDRLMQLQNPTFARLADTKAFEKINSFLQSVTGSHDAQIRIPHDKSTIMVEMDDKTLPLDSLGTGIHEVVILAAAATVLQEQVLCLEEPELHLHPLLQKQLVQYLMKETNNQYFISTHSAHLLDAPDAAVFHVWLQEGQSRVELVSTDAGKSRICDDLGYRASDLLQANSVIWVEGPSDRIYINNWLRAIAPDLIEGLHYAIMFYGGRLLSHLTAEDAEVNDFISLRRLNRHIAIVIDSDRSKSRDRINSTKRRVRDEFDNGPGFAWITKGREIENYVSMDILENAIKTIHRNVAKVPNRGDYEKRMFYKVEGQRKIKKADKVKVALEVVKQPAMLDVLDLEKMIRKLVDFICNSNDL